MLGMFQKEEVRFGLILLVMIITGKIVVILKHSTKVMPLKSHLVDHAIKHGQLVQEPDTQIPVIILLLQPGIQTILFQNGDHLLFSGIIKMIALTQPKIYIIMFGLKFPAPPPSALPVPLLPSVTRRQSIPLFGAPGHILRFIRGKIQIRR